MSVEAVILRLMVPLSCTLHILQLLSTRMSTIVMVMNVICWLPAYTSYWCERYQTNDTIVCHCMNAEDTSGRESGSSKEDRISYSEQSNQSTLPDTDQHLEALKRSPGRIAESEKAASKLAALIQEKVELEYELAESSVSEYKRSETKRAALKILLEGMRWESDDSERRMHRMGGETLQSLKVEIEALKLEILRDKRRSSETTLVCESGS
ncbi:uncharacterized protein RSE6_01865 [Rhynchosporium secalis]|uniref:Uncharacterized protein n=1 Tax=Rhynchosporium secalis TaxID=38038 RepID=A0A1E1M0H5_RHYSE|nr:uncharacterized protein RSE6_01865 [Rhynchosporium secalis]